MASDGPALLAAAVRAACLARAPRRTVQAVASAVAGVLARPVTAGAAAAPSTKAPPSTQRTAAPGSEGASPEELLTTLRAERTVRRRRKKALRRAAKGRAAEAGNEGQQEEPSQSKLPKTELTSRGGQAATPEAQGQRGDAAPPASSARESGPRRALPTQDGPIQSPDGPTGPPLKKGVAAAGNNERRTADEARSEGRRSVAWSERSHPSLPAGSVASGSVLPGQLVLAAMERSQFTPDSGSLRSMAHSQPTQVSEAEVQSQAEVHNLRERERERTREIT